MPATYHVFRVVLENLLGVLDRQTVREKPNELFELSLRGQHVTARLQLIVSETGDCLSADTVLQCSTIGAVVRGGGVAAAECVDCAA